jgi:peptidoglycan/xylan/chitin deacetylase (PgdA/CDA1 family)
LHEAAFWLFRMSGLSFAITALQPRKRAGILVYHNPKRTWFEEHMAFVAEHCSLISMDRLVSAVTSQDWSNIPPDAIVVTFDDGHAGNAHLRSSFDRFGVCPTIYLTTQIVGTKRHFWWTKAGGHARRLTRITNSDDFWRRLKEDFAFCRTAEYDVSARQALSHDEVQQLAGVASFGSHGRFHVGLPSCSQVDAKSEIELSKNEVERMTGRPCVHFCYPNGDHGPRERQLVQEAGYASARTTRLGWVAPDTNVYELPVLAMLHDASLNEVKAALAGYGHLLRLVRTLKRRFADRLKS